MDTTTKIAAELLATINNSRNLQVGNKFIVVTLEHDEYDSLKELLSSLLLGVNEDA